VAKQSFKGLAQAQPMVSQDVTIGVFDDHRAVKCAVDGLLATGIGLSNLSVIGRAFRPDEKSVGLHNTGGTMTVWGERGEFWSNLWRDFSGGAVLSMPLLGSVIVVGQLAHLLVSTVQEARMYGNLSVLGSTMFAHGISIGSVCHYERALMANGLLTLVHCTNEQLPTTRQLLSTTGARCATTHCNRQPSVDDGL
jgi:hypothetical protein